MKKAAKILGIAILVLFLLLISGIVLPFLLARVVDDIALGRYRSQVLRELGLPEGITLVETIAGCGNTGGTGNHTELFVAVLLKTELSEEEFRAYYPHAYNAEEKGWETWAMGCVGVRFRQPQEEGSYHILEFIKSAPWGDWDIRGH